jgi:NhaP-type Na+/H+ or K+/H+ antiporter
LKKNTKTSIKTEIALMLLGPYASYLVATGLNLSGICAILMNGVFLSSFGTPNL